MPTITDPTKELSPIKARTTKMIEVVASLVVEDDASLVQATKIRSGIKEVSKQIDQKKKEITAPMNAALKSVRALFAPLEEMVDEASRTVDRKVIEYNRGVEAIRQEAEAREAAKVEKGSIKIETAARHLEVVPEAQRRVATGDASLTITKVKKFEVTDVSKLPVEYLLPNEVAIRKAMFAGTELPGVRYFTEDQVSGR